MSHRLIFRIIASCQFVVRLYCELDVAGELVKMA